VDDATVDDGSGGTDGEADAPGGEAEDV
jgi:hypothetical protein